MAGGGTNADQQQHRPNGIARILAGLGLTGFANNRNQENDEFEPPTGDIFLTSGTGVLGYRVGTKLLDAGHKNIRAGVWSGGRLREKRAIEVLKDKGAELVHFDWHKPATFSRGVFVGVETVFCTIPYLGEGEVGADKFRRVLAACEEAGVKHFVKVSIAGSQDVDGPYRDLPFVKCHGTCDDIIERDGPTKYNMSFTILSVTHFMSNPLVFWPESLRSDQKFYGTSVDKGINYVSPNDVADAAVQILVKYRKYMNDKFTIQGPAAVTDEQVAELFSDFFDKPVTFVPQSLEEFETNLKGLGKPQWMINDMVGLEKVKASGIEEHITECASGNDFEKLCGRKPETYTEYLHNREAMTFTLEEGVQGENSQES